MRIPRIKIGLTATNALIAQRLAVAPHKSMQSNYRTDLMADPFCALRAEYSFRSLGGWELSF